MINIFVSVTVSFFVTFFSIPAIITIAQTKKLFDIPDSRKTHTGQVASLGGIGIFAGFILACLTALTFEKSSGFEYLIASAFIIFLLGLKDDILIISPMKKFIGQIVATILIIYKGNISINNLQGFIGIYFLPEIVSTVLTFVIILGIINAFNLIDGVDGLAATLGLMGSVVLGFYFILMEDISYSIIAFALAGSLTAFLFYNWDPAKIFMGDTGSLLIGLIISVLIVQFINTTENNNKFVISPSPAVGLSIVVIPLLDTLRVFSIRMFNNRSPFTPDRNHIHHLLLNNGLSHKRVTVLLLSANILFILIAFFERSMGTTIGILSILILYFLASTILFALTKSKTGLSLSLKQNSKNGKVDSFKKISNSKSKVIDAVLEN